MLTNQAAASFGCPVILDRNFLFVDLSAKLIYYHDLVSAAENTCTSETIMMKSKLMFTENVHVLTRMALNSKLNQRSWRKLLTRPKFK